MDLNHFFFIFIFSLPSIALPASPLALFELFPNSIRNDKFYFSYVSQCKCAQRLIYMYV